MTETRRDTSLAPPTKTHSSIASRYEVSQETGCWVWTGYADRNGYARTYDPSRPEKSRTQWAHRVSYEHHKGPIPDRYEVDHVCQNTLCVNPDHLEAVTKAEHVARTMRRLGKDDRHKLAATLRSSGLKYSEIAKALKLAGRESAYSAVQAALTKGLIAAEDVPPPMRLTEDEREDIRDLCALGVPQKELAAWYGIDNSAVSRIRNHVETRSARAAKGLAA
jgi:transposase